MKKLFTAFFCVLTFSSVTYAQGSDFGSWLSLRFNKDFDRAHIFSRLEHRSCDNLHDTRAWFVAAGAGYSFLPWLKADVSYEYWELNKTTPAHRITGDLTGILKREGLEVYLRERYEYVIIPSDENSSVLRSRLKVQYTFPKKVFRPYLQAEIFSWNTWERSLYYAGSEIFVDLHNCFDVFYLYNVCRIDVPIHIIGFGYCLFF